MSSSSIETTREQRRKDREERKKARNAQESVIQNGSVKREKTPRKHKLGSELSVGSNVHKKPPSGLKYGQQSFDRVKIIEKTPSIEIPEKENKEKMTTENSEKTSSSTRRRLGNKFLDNLSKFESHTVKDEKDKKEKNAFIRSHRSQNQDAGAPFRRSYRPPKSSTVIEDPVLMTRRSLRKERVAESIAKLEQNKTKLKPVASSPSSSRKRTAESPYAAKSTSVSSRPSSAGSTKTFSDSGSSTSSSRKLSRAEQAIERHKDRMRKTSRTTSNASITSSPGSPGASKFRISSSDSLPKTPKQKQSKETTPLKTQKSEEKLRKISVTKSPLDGGAVEITTVTELTSPTKEKMNIIVKERASSIEDVFEITGEVTEPERKSDEPRPISVSDAVALFSGDDKSPTGAKPLKSSEETNQQKTKRTRRKLPDITTVESQQKKSQGGARERRRQSKHSKAERKHSSQPEDGSGEPKKQLIEQNMIIVETSPSQELKTSKKKKSKKSSNAKLAPTFSQPPPNKTELEYEETDAIEVLRRLSEEVSSSDVSARSLGTDMHSSMTRSSMDEILIIEEEEVTLEIEDTTNKAFSIDNISEEILAATNERPTTLEIDEILCIAPTPEITLEEISQALVTPEKAPSVESPLKSPVKQLSVEEKVQLSFTPTQEVLSLQSPVVAQQLVTDREEMAGRKNLIRKSTISWLDDWSDDDDVSVLSDASTSDLEIDYEWLGITDSEDDDYIPKSINIRSKLRKFSNSSPKIITQSTPEPKKSAQIERVTSKAADMMALWERKAAEPTNSPSRARNIASEIRVGSVKAAWEDQDKKIRIMSVQEEDDGSMSNGTGKSDEMKGLFDSKISGKIQGAKALFETLAQTSPVLPRSPSINRSPVIRKQERKASLHSSDNSPLISRQSSIAENISEENGHDDSSDSSARSPDNFQNIDNVRAMFENDTISQKQTPGKHKMSLADIVSDVNDDCDITDVRSVKAMWESMDNHR